MRVLIVSCVFPPEPVVSAQTSAQIADELVRRGHDVTVITAFPNRPAGKLFPGYRRRFFERQKLPSRYELMRCFSTLPGESRMVNRFLENVSFGLTSGFAALTSRRPNVIYANTWPLFAGGILVLVAKLRGVPLVMSIQDVYPDSLVAQGRMGRDSFLARLLRTMDGANARSCRAVIVISERFARVYRDARCVRTDRIHIVPNWIDDDLQMHPDHSPGFRLASGIPLDAFLVVYGGNIGVAAGVETVIEAFQHLKDVPNLYLLVAGSGSRLGACRDLAARMNDKRIVFYNPWPAEETAMIYGAANMLILPTRGKQSTSSVPSKVIGYMLSSRPVLALAQPDTDLADLIDVSGAGWVAAPDRPEELARVMQTVVALPPEALAERGECGREYALRHLTSEVCLPQVVSALEEAAACTPAAVSLGSDGC